MAVPWVGAELNLKDEALDPEQVSERIGLAPTRSHKRRDPVAEAHLRSAHFGLWVVSVPRRESYEIDVVVDELLDLLDPHWERIVSTIQALDLTGTLYADVLVADEFPGVGLSENALRRMARLGVPFEMDVNPLVPGVNDEPKPLVPGPSLEG